MPVQKIKQGIEHLRKQSNQTKHVAALTFAIVIGAILAIIWGISIVSPKFNITSSDIHAFKGQDDPMIRSLQTGLQTLNENKATFDETNPYVPVEDVQNI